MDLELPCIIFVQDVPTDGEDWSEIEQEELRRCLLSVAQRYGLEGCSLTFDGNKFAVGCDRAPLADVCDVIQDRLKSDASRILVRRHTTTTSAVGMFTVDSTGQLPKRPR